MKSMKYIDVIFFVGAVLVLSGIVGVAVGKLYADMTFCQKYFPDDSTLSCMFSSKYKYDGG